MKTLILTMTLLTSSLLMQAHHTKVIHLWPTSVPGETKPKPGRDWLQTG